MTTPPPEAIEAAVALMETHYLDLENLGPDNNSHCVCGTWGEGEMEVSWDEHLLEVLIEAGWAPSLPIEAQALRAEADRWDAEYASPIRRTCPACGAKPGKYCHGGTGPMKQAHSQRRGERITPASLRARANEIEGKDS